MPWAHVHKQVADAKLLKEQIPKFEAYYIDNLIGKYLDL